MKPKLYMLSRPGFEEGYLQFLGDQKLAWLEQSTASPAERLVEFAGRICYLSFGTKQHRRTNKEYIANLIAAEHGSVLEHANWSFILSGVSRAFTHQLVRHRVGFSFSQLSQQYHDETEAEFVEPLGLEASPAARNAWREATQAALRAYQIISKHLDTTHTTPKAKEANRALRSAARSVLPNATATIIFVTANARALRHFLHVRGALEGDPEMRFVSKLIFDMLSKEAPSLVPDYSLRQLTDGSYCVDHTSREPLPVAAE